MLKAIQCTVVFFLNSVFNCKKVMLCTPARAYVLSFCRVNSYINNGRASQNLIDPDRDIVPAAPSSTPSTALSFTGKWTNLKQAFSEPADVPSFNHGHMISYFVSRTAADGLPAGDIKSINKAAKHLFDCGHVQNIEFGQNEISIYLQSTCLPEMRKDRVYKQSMCLNCSSLDITGAYCGCPAGKGPTASCKHIGALCYAFVEFCTSGKLPNFLTCTDNYKLGTSPNLGKLS